MQPWSMVLRGRRQRSRQASNAGYSALARPRSRETPCSRNSARSNHTLAPRNNKLATQSCMRGRMRQAGHARPMSRDVQHAPFGTCSSPGIRAGRPTRASGSACLARGQGLAPRERSRARPGRRTMAAAQASVGAATRRRAAALGGRAIATSAKYHTKYCAPVGGACKRPGTWWRVRRGRRRTCTVQTLLSMTKAHVWARHAAARSLCRAAPRAARPATWGTKPARASTARATPPPSPRPSAERR